jgi:hypothetical protein
MGLIKESAGMATSRFDRWSGLAAVVGGALWVVAFAVNASRSSGGGTPASYVSLHGIGALGLLALLLVMVGFVGLDMHMPSSLSGEGRGTPGGVGVGLAVVGLFVLIVSGALGFIGMLGVFVLMVGSALVGAAALLRRVLPRWGAIVLIVGSLLLLVFDTEGFRAWSGVPYGAAWIAVGYLLSSGKAGQVQAPARVR